MAQAKKDDTSTGPIGLMSNVIDHTTRLVKGEIDLARAEMQENLSKAIRAIGLIAGSVVVILVALNVLAAAGVAALAETGMGAGWAALLVGGILLVIGIVMVLKGKNDLSLVSLAPTRTATNIKRDVRTVKETTNG